MGLPGLVVQTDALYSRGDEFGLAGELEIDNRKVRAIER